MLVDLQQRLRDKGMEASWIPEDNLHLSLVFLGDVSENRLDDVILCLQSAASGTAEFAVTVTGPGWFGSPRSPRVLWAGIREEKGLAGLQARLNGELRALGFPTEDRPYVPHITLARIKPRHRHQAYLDYPALIAHSGLPGTCRVRVTGINLMQSILGPRGATYDNLFRQPLQGVS